MDPVGSGLVLGARVTWEALQLYTTFVGLLMALHGFLDSLRQM